jgi:hypothetical protein
LDSLDTKRSAGRPAPVRSNGVRIEVREAAEEAAGVDVAVVVHGDAAAFGLAPRPFADNLLAERSALADSRIACGIVGETLSERTS